MATTYTTQWTGRDAKTWSLVLHLTNDVTDRLTDLSIEEDDQDDYFAPIRSWTGRATLLGMEAGVLRQLLSPSAQASPCEVVRDGVTRWAGFVKPESLSQSFPGEGETVSVTLQGRLNTAGGQYLDAAGGRGFVTLGALLQEALYLCGYASTDVLWWPTRYQLDGTGEGLSVLSLQVSRGRFYEDSTQDGQETDSTTADVGGVSKTPYEVMVTAETVIEEIMKFFGLTLHERGTGLMAVSRGCNFYSSITLGGLTSITQQYVGNTPPTTASYTVAPSDIRRSGYTVSYRQGVKRVTVRSELSSVADSLPTVSCDGREFVGSYDRMLWFGVGDDPDAVTRVRVYELSEKSHSATFTAFSGSGFLDPVTNLNSWKNSSGGLDSSYFWRTPPGWTVPAFQRMGAVLCKFSPYTGQEMYYGRGEVGNKKRNYDFTEGIQVNMQRIESYYTQERWDIAKGGFLRLENKNNATWHGGAFILNFGVTAYRSPYRLSNPGEHNDPGPVSPAWRDAAEIGMLLTVGDYVWNGSTFVPVSSSPILYATIPIADTDSKQWPAVAEVQTNKNATMPYEGATGLVMQLPGTTAIRGDVRAIFYVLPKWTRPEDALQVLYFSNFSLTYQRSDDDLDREAAGSSENGGSDTRTIYRRTRNGFDTDGVSITLMLSSEQEGASGVLSTLWASSAPLTTLRDTVTGEVNTPERLLLGNLARDYDRIVEKRVVTVPLAGTMDEAGYDPRATYLLPDSDKSWHLLAVTENQAAGTAQLTLMDWAE